MADPCLGATRRRLFAVLFAIAGMAAGLRGAAAQTGAGSTTTPQSVCPAQPAMTFTVWNTNLGQLFGEGSREYIFADGFLCSDTDKQFQAFLQNNPPKTPNTIVVLNSGGGDLGAGMRMGEVIRKAKMWTEVGSQFPLMIPQNQNIPAQAVPFISEPAAPPFPGECDSACTLAFLGGVHRTISYASNYGVHQFESAGAPAADDQAQTEIASATIVAYLNEMGISPNWMLYMVQKRGNDVTYLSMQQLQQLSVVTPRWRTKWGISPLNDGSGFFLDGESADFWGSHEIAFTCDQPNQVASASGQTAARPAGGTAAPSGPSLSATFFLDPGPRGAAANLLKGVLGYGLMASGKFVPSFQSAQQAPAAVFGTRLAASLDFSAGEIAVLETIPEIGIAFLFDPAAKLAMRLLKFESSLDGALLKQFASTCR